jgi:hypothetical protein
LVFLIIINPFYSSSERYLIGSDQRLELKVDVTNEGEDAYEANLFITMPPNVDYGKTEMVSASNGSDVANVLCSPVKLDHGSVLKCELGNPMISYSRVGLISFCFSKKANIFLPLPH